MFSLSQLHRRARSDYLPSHVKYHSVIPFSIEILTLPLRRDPFLAREPLSLRFLQTLSFHANVAPLFTWLNAHLPEKLANGHMSTPICVFAILD